MVQEKKDCASTSSILFMASVRVFLYFPLMGIIITLFDNGNKNLTLTLYLAMPFLCLYIHR